MVCNWLPGVTSYANLAQCPTTTTVRPLLWHLYGVVQGGNQWMDNFSCIWLIFLLLVGPSIPGSEYIVKEFKNSSEFMKLGDLKVA